MENLYVDKRLTIAKVADEVGCTYKTARRWLLRHGIEIRTADNGADKQRESVTTACAGCGDELELQPWRVENYEKNYCDVACMSVGYTELNKPSSKIQVYCSWCNNTIEVYPSRNDGRNHFCNQQCYSMWQSENIVGEKHPTYKGGHPDYYGDSWKEMRRRVRSRDENECRNCGAVEEELEVKPHVHHIIPVREYDDPNDAHTMANMVQLCPSCHMTLEHLPPMEQVKFIT